MLAGPPLDLFGATQLLDLDLQPPSTQLRSAPHGGQLSEDRANKPAGGDEQQDLRREGERSGWDARGSKPIEFDQRAQRRGQQPGEHSAAPTGQHHGKQQEQRVVFEPRERLEREILQQ